VRQWQDERYFHTFSIFEEAQVFFDRNYTSVYDATESLPEQRRHIGAAFASSEKDINTLFREAKGVLENMPRYTHMEAYEFRKEEKPFWADNVVWLNIYLGNEKSVTWVSWQRKYPWSAVSRTFP